VKLTTEHASSSNIADYDAFVANVASTSTQLAAPENTWTAIASTATVAAGDNRSSNPGVKGAGVPNYLLNDTNMGTRSVSRLGKIAPPLLLETQTPGAFPGPGVCAFQLARRQRCASSGASINFGSRSAPAAS
jgi:hypothetical protein